MAETTFTTGIIALVDFAKDIEKIFAKDKNMVRTTKEAARLKFLELDEIFAKQEQEIVSLKAKLEISQNTANSQEQNDNIFLRGKLKESRRLLKEAQQEVITLKENTEIKNSITQNPQATNIKEKDQQIAFLKGQMEESRQMYKDLLKDNTTYFKEALTSTKIENSKQPSYAEVISNKNKATIIITPKDKEQPINEIRNNIQQQLKGTTEIENIKKVVINKNNQLIIKTTNKDQATKLKESIHKNDQLTKILEARSPQEKKLKTIIYGIPEEATENEILKSITTALDKDSEHTKLCSARVNRAGVEKSRLMFCNGSMAVDHLINVEVAVDPFEVDLWTELKYLVPLRNCTMTVARCSNSPSEVVSSGGLMAFYGMSQLLVSPYLFQRKKFSQQPSIWISKKGTTINALQNIISFISNAHARNHVTSIISLDVANAFNSANWSILKQKLQNLNIPTYLKAILHSFLQDRRVTLGEVNQPYDKGIPQGSCLGPILWNIFVNGILDIDVGQHSCIQAFADDVVILFSAPATYRFTNMCIAPLKKVSNWLIQNDLQLNHDKSIFSIFAKKNYSHIPNIKIGTHKIKYLKQFKHLGLVMDKQLSWHPHLDYVTSKITKLMQKINRTTRVYWGLSPPVKKEIYKRVLEKIMLYGHEIWFNGKAKQVGKLNKLQRIGLLNVTKCYRTVSTDALQILAGIPPIEVTLRSLTKLYQLRHLHLDISNSNLEKRPNIEPPRHKQKFKWRHLIEKEGGHCIFTDGSKMNNRVGSAMVVVENGVETSHKFVRINDEASVFMAELEAIEMAIHHIISNNILHSKIITDSRTVLQALNNPANCSPSIFQLKQLLSMTSANIELIWTRAHIGIHGNELADQFAKQATSKDTIDQHMYIPIRYIKKLLYHEILTVWQNHWVNSAKGRAVFEIYGKVNPKRILGNFFLN
ncbi:putative 115 kDa protein in type-1 retrotransposable element R1DM [Caerostris darwini]|uniref:115 kDa protein in type-1 retrotransposable element R1DM n=1 Tax=Caerostris darwini TaxID=1538125 RepID=A0AAV4N159_9ARAC|nr:putative 115 kDa protein in type-1 retrotransposable element R1DM [Caerostris darwini]